eukprot:CAMPEP_0202495930 /NCGR_PEP_ID=MMETSP1361-20130828/18321_1 /ASSEMBLY_ACC=CAM_ASM_000849 /TAXON_ID=210615 /ORGANISM="Staurosira complex sp., Strain CCMP2646" /LENGTH=237 /DNA_ID=CAMNT_0049127117 /DNA_START=41 /DNA_END=751 /DNA_ORIENTATION=+
MVVLRRLSHLCPLQFASKRLMLGMRMRLVMTESVEPLATSTVRERPCEVVLAQDVIYDSCWQQSFSRILPHERGLHYCGISVDCKNLQGGLDVLKEDLLELPNPVLVARGPLMSLIAQYYLESLPLAGLVLVDPILIHHVDVLKELKTRLRGDRTGIQREFVNELLTATRPRPLKLEPGAVPILVLQSIQDDIFRQASHDVAHRHWDPDGAFGEIPVHDLMSTECDATVAIDLLTEW